MDLGAGKIVMLGVPPVGCLPLIVTLNSNPIDNFLKRQCIPRLSDAARGFNQIVEQKIKEMERVDSKIYYVSVYEMSMDILHDPKKFGKFMHI